MYINFVMKWRNIDFYVWWHAFRIILPFWQAYRTFQSNLLENCQAQEWEGRIREPLGFIFSFHLAYTLHTMPVCVMYSYSFCAYVGESSERRSPKSCQCVYISYLFPFPSSFQEEGIIFFLINMYVCLHLFTLFYLKPFQTQIKNAVSLFLLIFYSPRWVMFVLNAQ